MAEEYEGEERRQVSRTVVSNVGYNRYEIKTTVRVTPLTVGTTAQPLIKTNPNRLAMIVINNSPNVVYANFSPEVSSDFGIILSANGGGYRSIIEDEGEAVLSEMWLVSGTADSKCTLIETIAGGG